jgi:hypothetical protein
MVCYNEFSAKTFLMDFHQTMLSAAWKVPVGGRQSDLGRFLYRISTDLGTP